jgi:transposase
MKAAWKHETWKRVTTEEKLKVMDLDKKGCMNREIAEALGRSTKSINGIKARLKKNPPKIPPATKSEAEIVREATEADLLRSIKIMGAELTRRGDKQVASLTFGGIKAIIIMEGFTLG